VTPNNWESYFYLVTLQVISNDRWNVTWFLLVKELFPLKDEALKNGQESLDIRSRSYKLALNSSKGGKIIANKKLQVGLKVK
jgi:hypothetical protein